MTIPILVTTPASPLVPAHRQRLERTAVVLLCLAAVIGLFGLSGLDLSIAEYCHRHRDSFLYRAAEIASWAGQAGWFLTPAALLWAAGHWRRRTGWLRVGRFLFLSIGLAALATDVLKAIVGRARPWIWFSDAAYGFHPFNLASTWQSFPSGHATTAMAAALAFATLAPGWRYRLLGFGFVVALSRVVVYAHYVSDVLAGALVASIVVSVVWRCSPDCCALLRQAQTVRHRNV